MGVQAMNGHSHNLMQTALLEMPPGKERRELIMALLEIGAVDRVIINTKYAPQLHNDSDLRQLLESGKLIRHRTRNYPKYNLTTFRLRTENDPPITPKARRGRQQPKGRAGGDRSADGKPPTEMQQLLTMYERLKIAWTTDTMQHGSVEYFPGHKVTMVTVRVDGNNPAVVGYSCFESCHYFDERGNLLGVGVWE